MRPELPQGTSKGALLALGAVAAARVVGLIVLVSALASGLADAASGQDINTAHLVLWGAGGTVLRALATWASRVIAVRASVEVKETLRAQLVEHHLAKAGASHGRDTGEAETVTLASRGLDGLDAFFRDYLPALVATAVVPAAVLVRILWSDWVSALIIILTIPLVPVFMALIGWHTEERVEEAQAGLDRLSRHLSELARGLPVLVGLRRAAAQREALFDISERYRRTTAKTLRAAFMSSFALELIATISVALVAVFIGVRLVWGTMDLEAGLVALMLAPEAYMALRSVGSGFHASEDGVAALQRVRNALEDESSFASSQAQGSGLEMHANPGPDDAGVGLEDVVISRGGDRARVGPVTLDARPGQVTVMVGPSGCGKSTVVEVLAGIVHAQGETALSGVVRGLTNMNTLDHTLGERRRGVAFQAAHGAEATARRELAMAAEVPAHQLAQVLEPRMVELLPEHLWDSEIHQLSPGEQRRLAIIRALLRVRIMQPAEHPQAGFLLLDEPTAHLDETSADRVVELVRAEAQRGTVILVATHDPDMAALGDSFLVWPEAGQAPYQTSTLPQHVVQRDLPDRVTATNTGSAPAASTEVPPENHQFTGLHQPKGGSSRKRAWWLLPLRKPVLWFSALLGALSVLAGAALTGVSGWLIVYASQQPPMMYLMVAIVGVRFFGLSRSTLRYAERVVTHHAVLAWASRLRVAVWDALGSNIRGWQRLARPGGAAGTLIAEVDELRDTVPRVVVPILASVAAILATAVAVIWAVPTLAGAVVILVGVGLVLAPWVTLAVERRASAVMAAHSTEVAARTGRVMAAAPDIAAHGTVQTHVQAFKAEDLRVNQAVRREALGAGVGEAFATALAGVGAVIALVLGAGSNPDPRLLALAVLLWLAVDEPLGQLTEALRQVPVLTAMLDQISPFVERSSREPGQAEASTDIEEASALPVDAVRAQDLSAAYSATGSVVFGPVSGEASPTTTWAVTGPSGSGKSTMIAVILGFLTPRSGEVALRLDQDWLVTATPDAHQSPDITQALAGVAWCPQDGYVFDSTVRGNLALGRGTEDAVSDEEMLHALQRVGLGRWALSLPDGLATRTGAGGSLLSGGQRQRLAVARTLLAGARIVILDEPTAHLGAEEGQALVTDVLSGAGDVALVLVTHDQNLASRADHVTRL